MIIHVVVPGDSIYSISQRYGVPPAQIIADNGITNPNDLVVGQTIVLKTDTVRHIVRRGDTMFSIARAYGVTLSELVAANPGVNPRTLAPGQVIEVPIGQKKLGTIEVNAYAFPNIDPQTLQKTLPYLTYLSIFSYQVKADGTLNEIEDASLIEQARQANVYPMMVITNIGASGGFDTELADVILTDQSVRGTLIQNILRTLKEKNYAGLDVDFEYIAPENRDAYKSFLQQLADELHSQGYILTVALAPKTSDTQRGLLYEAHDYEAAGQNTDHVILMTYEWGYTFGPPMAVAPADSVAKVLNYASGRIPPEKIMEGIPNYGYDWTLPYTAGTAARTVTNTGAVDIAARENTVIQYDRAAQSPYFYYTDGGGARHVVWFEDARSIRAKLLLANRYQTGGVSYWTINKYFPQNWLVLDSMFDIKKADAD